MEIAFSGPEWTGSLQLDADGWTLFSAPTSADAVPHMIAAPADPTPDQADQIAAAITNWAAMARARQHCNAQPDLLGFLS